MPAVATASGLPTRLGKYELLLPLAAGGMARIYIGRSTGIGSFERHVVLKLITPERANDHTAVQMFLDEARLAASLNHQNVAQVFEVGEDVGIHYLAMEYVHGQDLRAVLAKAGSAGTRIPLELSLTVVAGAAAGLNHAHERRGPDGTPLGIVHRDVSPSNIMIGYDGAVKLLDFGIAKATARSVETQSGIIKGKFAYMSPEQCRGRDVDRRSDVFSLGIILYEISTQHRCFRADSDFDTMHRIVTGDVVRPTRLIQGYPQALEAIVMKALAVDPNQRYQSAGMLLEAIESLAVTSHMSLSTMGLGRFMREMFGEVQEPWLNRNSQPIVQKENTISSTNGTGSEPLTLPVDQGESSGVPDDDARFPDSDGIAAKTILDLPRDEEADQPNHPAEWNARSYPSMPQAVEQPRAPAPTPAARPSYPAPTPAPYGMQTPMPTPGPQPPQQMPQTQGGAFLTPGSGSGPSHPAHPSYPQIPATRHGYSSGLGYPLYERPPDPMVEQMRLGPNRRPLYIGIGIVAFGVIALIIVLARSSKDEEPAPPPENSDNSTVQMGSSGTQAQPEDQPRSPEAPPQPEPDMIQVKIDSTPQGAEVQILGQKIGVTPLDRKYTRGTQVVPLTIKLAGYTDANTKIDLSGDVTRTFPLKQADQAPTPEAGSAAEPTNDDHKPNGLVAPPHKEPDKRPTPPLTHTTHHDTQSTHHDAPASHHDAQPVHHDTTPPAPEKKKCQPPNAIDPFDTSCDGKACPPCK